MNKRILFVSPIIPFPEQYGGSNHRISNILKALCKEYSVSFISYNYGGPPSDRNNLEGIKKLRKLCKTTLITPTKSWWPDLNETNFNWCYQNYIVKSDPFIFREYNTEFCTEIRRQARFFDLIWVERLWIAHHLQDLGDKIIVDIDDLESKKIYRKLLNTQINFNNLAIWNDYFKTKTVELNAIHTYKRIIICSEEDKLFWNNESEELKQKIWIVPNGFEESQLNLQVNKVQNPIVIFVGTLAYFPNQEAINFFIKKVIPLLKERYDNFEFWIVGRSLDRNLKHYLIDPCIKLFVDVPDVIPYLKEACVSVVPLQIAGGTRLKILESLSSGIPVVSSAVGVEGLQLEQDKHFLLAETPEQFFSQISKLIDNPDLREQHVTYARHFIQDKYRWSCIHEDIINKIRTLK